MLTSRKQTPEYLMRNTLFALVPGVAVIFFFWGYAFLFNALIAIISAVICEWLCLKLRKIPARHFVNDMSALLTGLLIALALPPHLPWWIPALASVFAISLGKHIYGGLGNNLFNPAMLGYAIMIVAFPLHLTAYPSITALPFDLTAALHYLGVSDGETLAQAMTGATPLEYWRSNQLNQMTSPVMWQAVNLAFALGGIWLVARQIITWHIPMAMIGALSLTIFAFSGSVDSVILHLMSGATMLGAFFIATDPVTSPQHRYAMLIFGGGVGFLLALIRILGDYADGLAFAVLLMNMLVPLLNRIEFRYASK